MPPSLLRAIIAFFTRILAYIAAVFQHHKEDATMKVDNTAISTQIDATAIVITGLLDKMKAAAATDAATIADLQAQVAAANDGHGATQVALDAANATIATDIVTIAGLNADLAASQQESTDLAAKLEAVKNLAAA